MLLIQKKLLRIYESTVSITILSQSKPLFKTCKGLEYVVFLQINTHKFPIQKILCINKKKTFRNLTLEVIQVIISSTTGASGCKTEKRFNHERTLYKSVNV